jgi:nucleotide-binding universal stress UspA family protein
MQAGHRSVLLVGVDGGRGTPALLGYAAELAAQSDASLLVAHIGTHNHLQMPDLAGIGDFAEPDSVTISVFATVVEFLGSSKTPWRFAGASGDPARGLARLAGEHGVGAVLVGASALGWRHRLRRIGRGSVATQLPHLQVAPVIVLPAGCSRRLPATRNGRLRVGS